MRRVILNFHGLGQPQRPLESGEDRYWVDAALLAQTLDLADRLRSTVDLHVTFDDGNLSDLELGAPLLEKSGRSATFFVLSDRIGTEGSLSADHLQELLARGHRIGTHGAAHVDWRALDEDGRKREYVSAREIIADAAGAEITEAAIPFGRYDARVLRDLKAAGYARVYSSDGGAWRGDTAPIPRTSPTADMTISDIEAILLGGESPLRGARRSLARLKKRIL